MDFAVITQKFPEGTTKTLRSSVQPPSPELKRQAEDLDAYLQKRVPEIERELVKAKLLDEKIPAQGAQKPKGNVHLWHALGGQLHLLCQEQKVPGQRERRWLWEAIENIHATERVKRAARGRSRNHFDYCYRVAQNPLRIAERLNWSEWVYFFDSPTVREEPRADQWLRQLAEHEPSIERTTFRRFVENLNKRIRGKDTSVLEADELFGLYEELWQATKAEVGAPLVSV